MKKTSNQYIVYIIFAVISIIINSATQMLVQFVIDKSDSKFLTNIIFQNISVGFCVKIFVATIVGFVFKFIVDKFVVFEQNDISVGKSFKQIILYGSFAVLTTLIFWATEFGFSLMFKTHRAEIIGAVIGLSVGYSLKFIFDKNVVFKG